MTISNNVKLVYYGKDILYLIKNYSNDTIMQNVDIKYIFTFQNVDNTHWQKEILLMGVLC